MWVNAPLKTGTIFCYKFIMPKETLHNSFLSLFLFFPGLLHRELSTSTQSRWKLMVSSVTLRHRFSTHMDSLTVEMASYRGMLHINMLITLVTNYTGH